MNALTLPEGITAYDIIQALNLDDAAILFVDNNFVSRKIDQNDINAAMIKILPMLKQRLIATIEAIAENYRLKFVAAKTGKAAEYQAKSAMADLVLAAPDNPPARAIEVLQPEAYARGLTIAELAAIIDGKARMAYRAAGVIAASVVEARTAIEALPEDDALPHAIEVMRVRFIEEVEARFQALIGA